MQVLACFGNTVVISGRSRKLRDRSAPVEIDRETCSQRRTRELTFHASHATSLVSCAEMVASVLAWSHESYVEGAWTLVP
jgi:hypothetical protein